MKKLKQNILARLSLLALTLILAQTLIWANVGTASAQTNVTADISDLTTAISTANLQQYIASLSAQNDCDTSSQRSQAVAYIVATLKSFGYQPIVQSFYSSAEGLPAHTLLQNVFARKSGTHPKATLLLDAHWDSAASRNFPPTCFPNAPGANDNATGVAAVLELARLLTNYQFSDDIEFAFFDGEEFNHLGSIYTAQNWYSDKSVNPQGLPVSNLLDLDMIGYPRDHKEIVWSVARSDNGLGLANSATTLVKQYLPNIDYRVYTIGQLFPANNDPNSESDMESFWDAHLGQDLGFEEDVSDNFGADPNYHSPQDTLYNPDGSLRLDLNLVKQTAQVSLVITAIQAQLQPRVFFANLNPLFVQQWEKVDRPVVVGVVSGQSVGRGFTWGPNPNHVVTEPYAEAPNGQRQVVYFDKVRMELTNPANNQVTNGLLVTEMTTGQLQIGDNKFEAHAPSQVPVAGDPNDNGQNPDAPTYSSFTTLIVRGATTPQAGVAVTETINKSGNVGQNASLGQYAHLQVFIKETGHNIPDVFWSYLNQTGETYNPATNSYVTGQVFDWVSTMGFPITDPYWVITKVGGVQRNVLVQLFQRRVLTYTPTNPDAFKVEMGNVGLHYYAWRYSQ